LLNEIKQPCQLQNVKCLASQRYGLAVEAEMGVGLLQFSPTAAYVSHSNTGSGNF